MKNLYISFKLLYQTKNSDLNIEANFESQTRVDQSSPSYAELLAGCVTVVLNYVVFGNNLLDLIYYVLS